MYPCLILSMSQIKIYLDYLGFLAYSQHSLFPSSDKNTLLSWGLTDILAYFTKKYPFFNVYFALLKLSSIYVFFIAATFSSSFFFCSVNSKTFLLMISSYFSCLYCYYCNFLSSCDTKVPKWLVSDLSLIRSA